MVRVIFQAMRFILPWVFRAIGAILWSMVIGVLGIFVGIPKTINRIAMTWQEKAYAAGFPTEFDKPLYYAICTVALLSMVAGWFLIAYFSVGILRLIFWAGN